MTITSRRHALFGQQLELLQLISDRGPKWVTVRAPNGSRRNVRRALTDFAQPLADSKSPPLISGRLLLRVVDYAEALSRRFEEENRNAEDDIAGSISNPAAALAASFQADPATARRTDSACITPNTPSARRR